MYKSIFTLFCFLSISFSQKAFAQNEFITEWLTTDGEISILTNAAQYTYNYNIAWYNKRTGTQLGAANNITGDYSISSLPTDTIEVRITGTFPHFYMNGAITARELRHVKQWGNIEWKNFSGAFYACYNLETLPTQAPNLTQVRDMKEMFMDADMLNQDLSTWDVSNVTDMSSMFFRARAFNGDVSTWDVSNVNDMTTMFVGAYAFNQDLSAWDISSISGMRSMFNDTNISYCNMDNILNAWSPILLNKTYTISYIPLASINSATVRAALGNRITLRNPERTNPISTALTVDMPDTICIGRETTLSASGANRYQWNGSLGSSTNTFVVNADTTLTLTGIETNGCEHTISVDLAAVICPSVDKIDYNYTIYPNPTNDLVTITLENIDYTNASIALMDITGRILSTTTLEDTNTTISLANYPAGLYLIKVQSGNTFFVEKVNKL